MSESLGSAEATPFYKKKAIVIISAVLGLIIICASVFFLAILPTFDKKVYSPDGNLIYLGQMTKESKNGVGTSYYEDGNIKYSGNWTNDKMNGNGSYYHENGKLKYAGEWSEDEMHGSGTLYDEASNAEFEGVFEASKPHTGKGTIKNASNEVIYIGELKNGLKEGTGQLFKDGNVGYDGQWLADKYHGTGKLIGSEDIYEGAFENAIRQGEGKSYSLDNELLLEGTWENDIFQTGKSGDGLVHYEKGRVTNLIPALIGDKYGYIDLHGNVVIQSQFTYAGTFTDGLARVSIGTDSEPTYGYIDNQGKYVITPQFDGADDFLDGYAQVMMITEATYETCVNYYSENDCYDFYDDYNYYQSILEQYHYGVIDKEGKVILPLEYHGVSLNWGRSVFSDGLVAAGKGEYGVDMLYGYMDTNGKYVINPQFNYGGPFNEGHAVVGMYNVDDEEWTYGLIDATGKLVIPTIYLAIERLSEGLVAVMNDDSKYGYVDSTGKLVIEPTFTYASSFVNGRAVVSQGEKYGMIDKTGKYIINPQFSFMSDFNDGLASVCNDKYKCGFIDETGKVVINYQFDYAFTPFEDGYAVVSVTDKHGIINKEGKFVVNPSYDYINGIKNGVFIGSKKGKHGIANLKDEVIVPFHYAHLMW